MAGAGAGGWKRRWRRRPSWKQIATFLYVWLMIGFASGTLVLVAPVRWITGYVHGRGWSPSAENVLMIGVIGIYLLASLALSLALTRLLFQSRARAFKYALVLGMTTLAGSALWGWSNPAVYASMAGGMEDEQVATKSGAVILFGPYPDHQRLAQLKLEGVTTVISLQHPAVQPFEPQGIAAERAATAELDLRFVNAPMLPWVSDNAASLELIKRTVTAKQRGKIYIHCGLGRDRVNVVKHMLEHWGITGGGTQLAKALAWQDRIDAGLPPMERGDLQRIGTDVWLVPAPNDAELFGGMLAGQAGEIVLLLDPADPAQREELEHMRRLFEQYGVDYVSRPLRADDAATAERIVQEIRAKNRPTTVVAPFLRPHRGAEVGDAFLEAWRLGTGLPKPVLQRGE